MADSELTQHQYGSSFMGVTSLSRPSAEHIVPLLMDRFTIKSVADFGCAKGTWLSVWQANGAAQIAGFDGDYLRGQPLEIDVDAVQFSDISKPIDVGRQFDLVQCLEVAEHVAHESAPTLVQSIVRHGKLILFSAAPPGQGGEHHVNEQPYAYWRDLFAEHGFVMFDCVRPWIKGVPDVRYWYRYNMFLFAHQDILSDLPGDISATRVPESGPVQDVSPLAFKARKTLIRMMPSALQDALAGGLAVLRTRKK